MGMTSSFSSKGDSDMNLEDLDDALHDTFAPKEKKDKNKNKDEDGEDIENGENSENGENGENKDDSPAVPEAPVIENEMTLTE